MLKQNYIKKCNKSFFSYINIFLFVFVLIFSLTDTIFARGGGGRFGGGGFSRGGGGVFGGGDRFR